MIKLAFRPLVLKPSHRQHLLPISLLAGCALVFGSLVSLVYTKPVSQVLAKRQSVPISAPTDQTPTISQLSTSTFVAPVVTPSTNPEPVGSFLTVPTFSSLTPEPFTAPVKRQSITWGITIRNFPFVYGSDTFLPKQFQLAKDLGISTVRVDYAPQNQAMNDLTVAEAKKVNLKLIFVIPFGPNDIFSDRQLYSQTYRYVSQIVQKYGSEVKLWQLGNEVASVALADEHRHGITLDDYPETKYQAVATWLKAANQAVKDNDPTATTIVTDQWVHTGFFDRFFKDGGNFDVLGWNWFSDMGTDLNTVHIDQKSGEVYRLLSQLQRYHKPIWLAEVNRRYGSRDNDETAEADYIDTMALYVKNQPLISGFFVFDLVGDQQATAYQQDYGLIKINKNDNSIDHLTQAYWRYQGIIRQ